MEEKHKIEKRWLPDDTIYKEQLMEACDQRKFSLLNQLEKEVMERKFLLSLIRKYAGINYFKCIATYFIYDNLMFKHETKCVKCISLLDLYYGQFLMSSCYEVGNFKTSEIYSPLYFHSGTVSAPFLVDHCYYLGWVKPKTFKLLWHRAWSSQCQ